MSITDLLWGVFWFVGGCFVFQVRGLKSTLNSISTTVFALSLITLLSKADPLTELFLSISLGYITGMATLPIYLIGANISRYEKFHKMSPLIIFYILCVPIWIALEIQF